MNRQNLEIYIYTNIQSSKKWLRVIDFLFSISFVVRKSVYVCTEYLSGPCARLGLKTKLPRFLHIPIKSQRGSFPHRDSPVRHNKWGGVRVRLSSGIGIFHNLTFYITSDCGWKVGVLKSSCERQCQNVNHYSPTGWFFFDRSRRLYFTGVRTEQTARKQSTRRTTIDSCLTINPRSRQGHFFRGISL